MKILPASAIYRFLRNNYLFPLTLSILVVAALMAINEMGFRQSNEAALRAKAAQQKRGNIGLLLQQMLDAETGQRGYLLTGQKRYLEPYNTAVSAVAATLDKLRTAYLNEPKSLQAFANLSRAISRKMGEMDVSIKLRDVSVDADKWLAVLDTGVGDAQMDLVRASANELLNSATSELSDSFAKIHSSLDLSRIGIALTALLGVFAFYQYLRKTQEVERLARREQLSLASEAKRLDALVNERTDALTELATHLQTVQEKERELLARELHDELGAMLTAAKLDIARTKGSLPPGSDKAIARLAHLNDTINDVVKLKRRIIEDLRPSSLANLGLTAALEVLARDYRERSEIEVTLNLEQVELSAEAELTIFRLVQESLTNVAKYAEASEVVITLHVYSGHVEVSVADNGRGFDTAVLTSKTHGLNGMRHRIGALRGNLLVKSSPEAGTRIEAVIHKAVTQQS
ncbi:MAG: CHASE3 domain-containing protein [Casimicrobium sp.]